MIKLPEAIDPKAVHSELVREHARLHEQISKLKLACGSIEAASAKSQDSQVGLRDAEKKIFHLLVAKFEADALGAAEEYAELLEKDAAPLAGDVKETKK